jgi:hypothetical protein
MPGEDLQSCNGAYAIKCGYAARGIPGSSALTRMVQCTNANMIFPDAKNTMRDEKMVFLALKNLLFKTLWGVSFRIPAVRVAA